MSTEDVLQLVAPPVLEPLTTAEAKLQAHVDVADEDALVDDLIAAAREDAEKSTVRALITQTWELTMPAFRDGRLPIELRRPPVQSVESVIYTDTGGTAITMDPADYVFVAGEPGRIYPASGATWPTVQEDNPSAVAVRFVAGYGATPDDVPYLLRQAMKLYIATEYAHREDIITGTILSQRRAIESIYRKFSWDLVLA